MGRWAAPAKRWCTRPAPHHGIKVGLFRPISLWPFPEPQFRELAKQMRGILVAEMSRPGQMLEDVRLAVEGRCPVAFFGRMGGVMPLPDEESWMRCITC